MGKQIDQLAYELYGRDGLTEPMTFSNAVSSSGSELASCIDLSFWPAFRNS